MAGSGLAPRQYESTTFTLSSDKNLFIRIFTRLCSQYIFKVKNLKLQESILIKINLHPTSQRRTFGQLFFSVYAGSEFMHVPGT